MASTGLNDGIRVPYVEALQEERGRANVETGLLLRNAEIANNASSMVSKLATKTGTTICGCLCRDGVVLASDTRASMGDFVSTPKCQKLHTISNNIWCAGAGVAADLLMVSRALSYDLKLFKMPTKRMVRVNTVAKRAAEHLFRYQGVVVVYFIVAGVDPTGAYLFQIAQGGVSNAAGYCATGSGGYFARAVLEANYRDDLTVDEGAELCADAIQAGILHDLGSGSVVDVVKIRMEAPEQPELIRDYRKVVGYVMEVPGRKLYPRGTTRVLKETIIETGAAASNATVVNAQPAQPTTAEAMAD